MKIIKLVEIIKSAIGFTTDTIGNKNIDKYNYLLLRTTLITASILLFITFSIMIFEDQLPITQESIKTNSILLAVSISWINRIIGISKK